DHAVGTSAGSLSPRTNWQSMGAFELVLPTLDHQREVAGVLGAIGALQEALGDTGRRIEQTRVAHLRAGLDALSRYPVVALSEVATRVGVGIASSVTHAY